MSPKPLAAILLVFGLLASFQMIAQEPVAPPPDQTLTADQLDNLVAPIALYPDPLLGQEIGRAHV